MVSSSSRGGYGSGVQKLRDGATLGHYGDFLRGTKMNRQNKGGMGTAGKALQLSKELVQRFGGRKEQGMGVVGGIMWSSG